MAKKPKAWSNLKGVLPEKVEDAGFEEKVLEKLDSLKDQSFKTLAERYDVLVVEEEKASLEEDARNVEYEALSRLMVKGLESTGSDIWRGDKATFSSKHDIYPTVEDKAALKKWVKSQGLEDLLTLAHGTLKSECTEALGPGGSGVLPDGVKVYIKTSINRRKA